VTERLIAFGHVLDTISPVSIVVRPLYKMAAFITGGMVREGGDK
jgi:hypothetical protein